MTQRRPVRIQSGQLHVDVVAASSTGGPVALDDQAERLVATVAATVQL